MSVFRFKQRRGTTEACEACIDVPLDGEIVLEKCLNNSVKMKIGDGSHVFSELPYIANTEDSIKLATIEENANNYVLPVAGDNLGGVKSGTDIVVDENGNVTVNDDSHNHIISNIDDLQDALDAKQPNLSFEGDYDSSNNKVATKSYVDTAISSYELPIASEDTLGGIKIGVGLSIAENGTLSVYSGGVADAVEWEGVLNKPEFANVATTGSYNDLSDVPDTTVDWDDVQDKPTEFTPASHEHNQYLTEDDVAEVAISGDYSDLINIPETFAPSEHTHSQYLTEHQILKTINNQSIVGSGNITIEAGSDYTLPTASASTLGGIKVGTGLAIDSSGVLSTSNNMEEYSDTEIQGFWDSIFNPSV